MSHDHDHDDDFALWVLFMPETPRGWAGLVFVAAWIALGVWWFS